MAKDIFHATVKKALEKDGWIITNDPYKLKVLDTNYDIDLGAEKLLAAEKGNQKIAVEVKSFIKLSFAHEFHSALGQYLNYASFLQLQEPTRILYLAIAKHIYSEYFTTPSIAFIVKKFGLRLIVFNPQIEIIETWLEN
jgi:hypothetical protein